MVPRAVKIAVVTALLASCGGGPMKPDQTGTLRANAGGPYVTQHNVDVTFDGLSSTVTGATITTYSWTCGQAIQTGCNKTGPRPVFNYRKCGVTDRPPCDAGSTLIATYVVTLTVTDSTGRTNTATTSVRVTNDY